MTIAEFHGTQVERGDNYDRASAVRTPPQDEQAEQSVLGAMLLSKDAIADVVEVIRGTDFYRPAHELVFDTILDLYGRGEPADAITVTAELTRAGDAARVGGAPYLHTLVAGVPLAANAGYYAGIVREKAILRRLVDAGTKIVQLGYAAEGQVDDVVDRAQAEVFSVTDKRTSEDYAPLAEIMELTIDELEAIGNRDGAMSGVPTGFAQLDDLTNGLHGGQMVIVAARPAVGKALALDTAVPTPSGWTTMGEVSVGDFLVGADGRPTRVVRATDVMRGRPCYRVTFSDGTSVVADAQHQWLTDSDFESAVRTTEVLARDLERGAVHSVRRHAPLRGEVALTHWTSPRVECGRYDDWKVASVVAVASVPVRCVEVDSADHLYLATRAMIPTHNSTLGLDIARSASIKHGLASVIFSLEMSRTEITMRLLSAEARVPMHHMRNGKMSDDDWQKLVRKIGEVSAAPLFIDDSPNLTMMEIRAKARRLKQRHDLRLIVVDYLQLMTSGKKVESRQVEVSEFSRQIKLLAKELDVPVVAIAQLNRGSEQRTSKRPLLSDLRESGCLSADTRLMRADTNVEVSLGELMSSGARDIPVWSLDDRLKLVPRTMTHAFPSGVKEIFRLRLASGREVQASANHPFLTYDGWKPLGDLATGSRIGSIRHVPPPLATRPMDNDEVVKLAHQIGAGSLYEQFVPAPVFSAPKAQIGLFLRHLWATDGSVRWDTEAQQVRLYYASTSRRLVGDIARLLLRYNVFSRIKPVSKTSCRDCYHLLICGVDNQRRFLEEVGVHGARGDGAAEVMHRLQGIGANTNLDTIPREVWLRVKEALVDQRVTQRQFASAMGTCGSTLRQLSPSRQPMAQVAEVLGAADLEVLATNDVCWDEVVSVESLGEHAVYDATVLGTHNFIADGVPAHNSLEQDSDMVILLHREDLYEKESTRPGEADLIVAKHRNGPTADLVLAFQGHYSRFVDIAHG